MHEWVSEGWLSGPTYDRLRAEDFATFCTAAGVDQSARVPTCPEWDVAALCEHLGTVYQRRSWLIEHRAFADPDSFELKSEDEGALDWARRWSDALDSVLEGRADDEPSLSFMSDPSLVLFWRRRMALETMVHRTDAEIAVGAVSAMDDALSADGVDELLWFLSHPEQEHDDGVEDSSVVELTDGVRTWAVELADGAYGAADPGAPADARVEGSSPALLLALSGRDLEGIGADRFGVTAPVVSGDGAAWRRLLDRLGGF